MKIRFPPKIPVEGFWGNRVPPWFFLLGLFRMSHRPVRWLSQAWQNFRFEAPVREIQGRHGGLRCSVFFGGSICCSRFFGAWRQFKRSKNHSTWISASWWPGESLPVDCGVFPRAMVASWLQDFFILPRTRSAGHSNGIRRRETDAGIMEGALPVNTRRDLQVKMPHSRFYDRRRKTHPR